VILYYEQTARIYKNPAWEIKKTQQANLKEFYFTALSQELACPRCHKGGSNYNSH